MRRVAALLAAVLLSSCLAACGGGGAEPGAPKGATLVLDFTPNAVHSGIYLALQRGYYRDAGVEPDVRQPGTSSDAPKLLASGRADFAILDIHDLGIARERGLDPVGVMPIVQRPLASVLAAPQVRRPRELEGRTVGVTGLPSDDAVLDSIVAGDGGDPAAVRRVTIGFNAVASLAARKVDAATGFWNAEGVALRRRGVPTRIFRVDRYGAPPYPELVLCAGAGTLREDPALVRAVVGATTARLPRRGRRPGGRPRRADRRRPRPRPRASRPHSCVCCARSSPPPRSTSPCCAPGPAGTWAHGLLQRPLDPRRAFSNRFR